MLFIHHAGSAHSQIGDVPIQEAEIIIGKHRNGPEGFFKVKADLEHFRFTNFGG